MHVPLRVPAAVVTGLDALRANPLRTLLSTIGVVMGAASLAAVLSLGDGAESFARQRIAFEGMQRITVEARTADLIDGHRVPRDALPHLLARRRRRRGGDDARGRCPPRSDRAPHSPAAPTVSPASRRRWPRGARCMRCGCRACGWRAPTPTPSLVAGRWFTNDELRTGARVAVITPKTVAALLPSPHGTQTDWPGPHTRTRVVPHHRAGGGWPRRPRADGGGAARHRRRRARRGPATARPVAQRRPSRPSKRRRRHGAGSNGWSTPGPTGATRCESWRTGPSASRRSPRASS